MSDDPSQGVGDEPALAWRSITDQRSGDGTWSSYVQRRRAGVAPVAQWGAVALAALVAGPTAVLGALLSPLTGGASVFFVLSVVVLGPAAEEVLKAAAATYLAERRPWLVPAAWTLVACTLVSGLVFAAIENAMYLNVYIDAPSTEIVRFRWIAGPLLHGAASTIAGVGIARAWLAGDPPTHLRRTRSAPWLVAAIVLHGAYNGAVTLLAALERGVPTG